MIHLGTSLNGLQVHLPLDVATESMAIISRKGAGKTHTGRAIAEDLLEHHVQVVVADPMDVWWGIRVAKNGKGEGCNVVIFGGSHADLPLTETAGKALADIVIDLGISAILVTDHLSIAASRRFMADFGERLYDRKRVEQHRTPLCLIVDEADRFAPQQVTPEAARCTGVLDELARRGRSRGIGLCAITQRPAVLNKNVLTQTEILICLQVNSPQDRKALELWIEAQAEGDQAKTFMSTLAGFQRGEAWVWSPSKLRIFTRIVVRDVRTYDSSYTPKVGEKRPAAPRLRAVDLDALRTQLAATIEQAEANDPTKLRHEVARLKKELAAKPTTSPVDVGKAVHTAFAKAQKRWLDMLRQEHDRMRTSIVQFCDMSFDLVKQRLMQRITDDAAALVQQPAGYSSPHPAGYSVAPLAGRTRHWKPLAIRATTADNVSLSKGERMVLSVLATWGPSAQRKVAALTGYRLASSTWRAILGKLRKHTAPPIETADDGTLSITEAGHNILGDVDPLPTGQELIQHWRDELGPDNVPRRIFDALVDAFPAPMHVDEMASAGGCTVQSSTFRAAMKKLKVRELMHRQNDGKSWAASGDLMEAT